MYDTKPSSVTVKTVTYFIREYTLQTFNYKTSQIEEIYCHKYLEHQRFVVMYTDNNTVLNVKQPVTVNYSNAIK
jgi:hypothetical protein